MNKKCYLLVCYSLLFFSCSIEEITDLQLNRPNILLIIADDLGLDATPGFIEGTSKPNMPNLEDLISKGLRFQNLWSAPTCSPTRATILTGKYGIKTGVLEVGDQINNNEITIQSFLDDKTSDAYSNALIGKWHLSNSASTPISLGIDYYAGILGGGVRSYTNWDLTENGITTTSTEYTTSKLTDLSIDWIDKQNKPWFLWLAYNAPHTPFHVPPNDLHSQGNLSPNQASIESNPLPYYFAALEAMDTEIGRLLNSIPDEQLQNTTIIFIGDNGTPSNVAQEPFSSNRAKGSLYQGGINVPMVISGYGVSRANETENAIVNTSDIFATIADIAGSGVTSIHNSISFMPKLTMSSAEERSEIYSETGGNNAGYTIRDNTYKLIVFNNGNDRFYNLISDPYEETNLINRGLNVEESSAMNKLIQIVESIRQ